MTVAAESALQTPIQLPDGGFALFTARDEGNLSKRAGPDAADAERARERLRESLGLDELAYTHQVHGNTVVVRSSRRAAEEIEADGQATALAGTGVAALTADCVPVALGTTGAVAMLHAGWRGLAAGVLQEGVRTLRTLPGVVDIVAVVGPAAGPCCYEAGDDVREALGGAHFDGSRVDLRAVACSRLRDAGVTEIGHVDVCTICDQRLFSHRREGAAAGRQAGVAWRS
jgi:YfiH family protein